MQSTTTTDLKITVRAATATDMPAALSLIKDLAEFENAPEAVILTLDDLTKDGFGEKPLFKAFVAELNNEVVGMALTYIGYSTWKGKLVYLDDIVVREKHRSKGIGELLFNRVIEYATNEKARVLKWQVLRWNKDAIRFYERFSNVVFDDEWVDCKLHFRS
ncbi:MAG: GNAT family N-acetyltransferase [Chitinophagales bacterium]|nr:GNAT family N-acetyltransferase [Chitinophagales bacterium]